MAEQKELDQKSLALDQAIIQIEKQFGKGSIMRLGDDSAKVKVAAIPTGSIELDGYRRYSQGKGN
jgi:recombination protein RecA